MDCGTCDSAPALPVEAPAPVNVNLTITAKARAMLSDAFGDTEGQSLLVGVLSGGCSGYMYDLQIIVGSEPDCQSLEIEGINVQVPNASSQEVA